MAKNINHIQHVKSNIKLENGSPKLPSSDVLVEGELAINYASGVETISIKNSSGEIVTFSSDRYFNEKYIGNLSGTVEEIINESDSATTAAIEDINDRLISVEDATSSLTESIDAISGAVDTLSGVVDTLSGVVEENELVTAAALNELNSRKLDVSAYTPTDLSNYYTKDEIDESEEVISSALNDLNSRKLDVTAYTPTDLSNYYTKGDVDEKVNAISGKVDSISGDVSELSNSMSGYVTTAKFEEKLGSGFTGENSGRTLTEVIVENELIIASSLTDLDSRKLDASAYTETDLSNYYTKGQVDNLIPNVTPYFDDVEYDSTNKRINFKHGATVKDYVDATAFIKDGMVNTVSVSAVTSGASTVDCLVITFNTDAGKDDIKIPLSMLFDSSNYYNKSEVDGFVESLSGIIEDNELVVASSLTDLDSRKLDASAFTSSMSNVYTKDEIDNAELAIASALNDLNSRVDEVSGNSIVLDDEFSYSGSSASTNAVEAQAIIKYLEQKELVIAAALTDLDSRLQGVAYQTDLDDLAPLSVFDDSVSASTKPVEAQALYNVIVDNEYTTSTALNNLDERLKSIENRLTSIENRLSSLQS